MPDAEPTTNPAAIRAWLGILHDTSPGLIHISSTGNWNGRRFADLDQAADHAAALDATGPAGVYVRMTTLKPDTPDRGRGSAADSAALPALWADLDIAGPGHKTAKPLPPDEASARSIITEAGLPDPSVWVHSGGGLYPIWLLDQPWQLDDDDLADAEAMSAGWQQVIGAAAERLGWTADLSGKDLARVLRLPGTVNRKVPYAPTPCRIRDGAAGRYTLGELRTHLILAQAADAANAPPPARPPTSTPRPITTPSGDRAGDRPGDDYTNRTTWAEVLEPRGWKVHYVAGEESHWTRPGKTTGTSATTNYGGSDRIKVFSDNAGLPTDGTHSRYEFVVHADHGGDFTAATRALAAAGYGQPATPRRTGEQINAELLELAGPDARPPFAPGQADSSPPRTSPSKYFDTSGGRKELLAATLAADIAALGPLAEGIDDRTWSYHGGVWKPTPHIIRDRTVTLLGEQFRITHASNAAAVVKAHAPTITSDPVYEVINFTNGLYYWQPDMLQPHDPTVMTTVQLAVDYDPHASCPEFDQFLTGIVPADTINTAWELIGYLMLSGNPLHKAVMLIGTGRNGKGTLLRVIVALLGKQNVASISLHTLVDNRFATANLFGKIANIAGDIDGTYLESTATLKAITGDDLISAEHKGRDMFNFTAWAVPVFSANKIPPSADVTSGYLSRWLPIEFPTSFVGREDPELTARLTTKAELAGVAAKAVPALRRLMARGRFEDTESSRTAVRKFARHVDQVRAWLDDCTQPDSDHWEPRVDLYRFYKNWINREGGRAVKAGDFYDRLEGVGATPLKHVGTRGFTGISVTDRADPKFAGLL